MSSSKYKIPKMTDGSRFTFRRQGILDGDARVYFGPGQPPCAWPGLGNPRFDTDEFSPDMGNPGNFTDLALSRDYISPADWPQVGSLLRVPQVVHLSLGGFSQDGTDFVAEDPLAHGWPGDPYPLFMAEKQRLIDLFNAAKAQVEALRPGRTFVNVAIWKRTYNRTFDDNLLMTWADFRRGQRVTCLPAPPVDTDGYFGVDYLNIFAGHLAKDIPGDNEGFSYLREDHINEIYDGSGGAESIMSEKLDDLANSDEYSLSSEQVIKAKETFAGWRTMLYSADVSDPQGDLDPLAGIGWLGGPRDLDTPPFDFYIINVGYGSRQFLFDDIFSQRAFSQIAEDLSDYGVTHDGNTSDLASVDQIVGIIADHFGFDPETGADILG